MKVKQFLINIIAFLISLLIGFEAITNKSIMSKIAIALVVLLFIWILFTKKISKKEWKSLVLLICYTVIFSILKIGKYDIRFILNSLLIIAKIFSFPVIIFCVLKLFQGEFSEKQKYISLSSVSILAIISLALVVILKKELYIDIVLISILLALYITCKCLNKKILNYSIFTILIVVSVIVSNAIAPLIGLLIIYTNCSNENTVEKITKIRIIKIVGLILIGLIMGILINTTGKDEKTQLDYPIVNPQYEVQTINYSINTWKDIGNFFWYNNNREIAFGADYYNVSLEENSILYILCITGIIGLIIYILLWKYTIELLEKRERLNFIYIIFFCAITEILTSPIIAFMITIAFFSSKTSVPTEDNVKTKDFIIAFIMLILSLGIGFVIKVLSQNNIETINIDLEVKDELIVESGYNLIIKDKKENTYGGVNETKYQYVLTSKGRQIAEIIYSKRKISDVEIEYFTITNGNKNISLNLILSDNNSKEIMNFEQYNVEFPYSGVVGYNKIKLPIGYYEIDNKYMIVGRSIEYNTLTSVYNDYNKSTVYHLIDQKDDFNSNKKTITIGANNQVDTYIIKSDAKLLKDADSLKEFINVLNGNSSWLTYKGSVYKIQYSIDPFTREGYGKILGRMIEEEMYNKSKSNSSIIYDAISKDAIFSLYNYTPRTSKDGVWLTNYTSTWLSKDYGTKAFYVDTRYNETIGYHLLEMYKENKQEEYKKAFLTYADFIIKEWNGNNTYKVGDVKLLSDYFSDTNTSNPHSSLNHQLALVNYLYKAYSETGKEIYLNTADDILNNLLVLGENWIRDNGDLWYEINPQGNYLGNDYEIVTLDDLLFTQTYLYNIKGEKNKIVEKLINSKVNYLEYSNISIPQFTQSMIKELEE